MLVGEGKREKWEGGRQPSAICSSHQLALPGADKLSQTVPVRKATTSPDASGLSC